MKGAAIVVAAGDDAEMEVEAAVIVAAGEQEAVVEVAVVAVVIVAAEVVEVAPAVEEATFFAKGMRGVRGVAASLAGAMKVAWGVA